MSPREIFGPALRTLGCASQKDIALTKDLIRIGKDLEVQVVDHVILASDNHRFLSMAEQVFM